mmetsp:Transcript_52031/g.113375  ORF Transcript_52031/g.113375 Transcript_52031/m.113375 type:complete len:108 (+) Transcript_52031:866-1189(+)
MQLLAGFSKDNPCTRQCLPAGESRLQDSGLESACYPHLIAKPKQESRYTKLRLHPGGQRLLLPGIANSSSTQLVVGSKQIRVQVWFCGHSKNGGKYFLEMVMSRQWQ